MLTNESKSQSKIKGISRKIEDTKERPRKTKEFPTGGQVSEERSRIVKNIFDSSKAPNEKPMKSQNRGNFPQAFPRAPCYLGTYFFSNII